MLEAAGPLDLVLLGIGEDGHTASIFPAKNSVSFLDAQESGFAFAVRDSPKPPSNRISMTFQALASAKQTVVYSTGEKKGDVISAALERKDMSLPIARDVLWLVDNDAAAKLTATSSSSWMHVPPA